MREEFPDLDLIVREGDSHEEMASFDPGSFDLVYIDALHSPEPVARDTAEAVKLCKPTGIIIFNDYVMLSTSATRNPMAWCNRLTPCSWSIIGA